MAIKFKTFKPKDINPAIFNAAFLDAAKEMASDVHDDFDDITRRWKHAVDFEETVKETSRGVELSVLTADLGFKYYDQGNGGPNEIIRPKRAKALHWIDDSGDDVFRKSVHGYDGRKVVDETEKVWRERAPSYFEDGMVKAVKESGHAL